MDRRDRPSFFPAAGSLAALFALLSLGGCALVYGYGDYHNGSGGAGATGGNGGESGSGGTGGGPPPGCDPTMSKSPIASSCGVFVSRSKGADTNPGSQSAPFKTIGHAISHAGGMPVYACAEEFDESVVITSKTLLFGGLDCKHGWAYVGNATKTTIKADADAIALKVEHGGRDSQLSDLHVEAIDAKKDGESSIAVLVDSATVELTGCEIVAGRGANGTAGTSPTGKGTAGKAGTAGAAGCTSATSVQGGPGALLTCPGNEIANGGDGGNGTSGATGGMGNPGSGTPMQSPSDGAGGDPQKTTTPCSAGDGGGSGLPGPSGDGATGLGSLSSSGYVGSNGGDGKGPGVAGQGGGGGGGASVRACNPKAGPSGGGGGSGGCGGAPAGGGGPAGSSIGIVNLGGTLTLTDVSIQVSNGGIGGGGGDGQPGGSGGMQGLQGGSGACAGGIGGDGGHGGSGGGGLGGHSVGIATKGGMVMSAQLTIDHQSPGDGGSGGDMDTTADGAPGMACPTLDFTNGTCM